MRWLKTTGIYSLPSGGQKSRTKVLAGPCLAGGPRSHGRLQGRCWRGHAHTEGSRGGAGRATPMRKAPKRILVPLLQLLVLLILPGSGQRRSDLCLCLFMDFSLRLLLCPSNLPLPYPQGHLSLHLAPPPHSKIISLFPNKVIFAGCWGQFRGGGRWGHRHNFVEATIRPTTGTRTKEVPISPQPRCPPRISFNWATVWVQAALRPWDAQEPSGERQRFQTALTVTSTSRGLRETKHHNNNYNHL